MSSEWWIKPGTVEYCDGDICDMNHDMVAEAAILEELGFDLGDEPDFQTRESAKLLFTACLDGDAVGGKWAEFAAACQKQEGEGAFYDWRAEVDLDDYLRFINYPGERIEALITGMTDARAFAVRVYGWKRVEGRHLDSWTLTEADCRVISEGLFEIHGECWTEYTYTLHVSSPRKVFVGVCGAEIENNNVAARFLRPEDVLPAAYGRAWAHPGD